MTIKRKQVTPRIVSHAPGEIVSDANPGKLVAEEVYEDVFPDDGHDEMMDALGVYFHMLTCPNHTSEERKAAALQAMAAYNRYADGDADDIEDDERINAPTSYAVN